MAAKKGGRPKAKKKATAKREWEAAGPAVDQRLMKALGHPLRIGILTVLNDRTASPNELSKQLEEGLSQVSYHVKVLKDFEMIEMVKTEPRRGAVEHYYRAVSEVFLPSWQMKLMPKSGSAPRYEEYSDRDLSRTCAHHLKPARLTSAPIGSLLGPRGPGRQGREDAEEAAAEFLEAVQKDQR